jgi:hypothetical protein
VENTELVPERDEHHLCVFHFIKGTQIRTYTNLFVKSRELAEVEKYLKDKNLRWVFRK